jgi:hypothetical protein
MTSSAALPMSRPGTVCCICAGCVSLETSKTNERGNAVHEECYVRRTISRFRTGSPVQLAEDWLSSRLARFQLRFRARAIGGDAKEWLA